MKALDVFSISINHMKSILLKKIGAHRDFHLNDEDIDFVLTVPSILGDAGKLFMQEAAVQVRLKFAISHVEYILYILVDQTYYFSWKIMSDEKKTNIDINCMGLDCVFVL